MSLEGLSAERLVELGGLKERCSAGLRCVAHGLALPCGACEAEDEADGGVVCEACGHHFRQGLLSTEDRGCQSSAEFAKTGRIAFEDVALAGLRRLEEEQSRREAAERAQAELRLQERQRERETLERQRREEAERAERERVANERAEAERRNRLEREREELLARERQEEEARAEAERRLQLERVRREAERETAASRRWASLKRWGSAVALAGFALMSWNLAFVHDGRFRSWFPDGFGQKESLAIAPSVTPAVFSVGASARAAQPAPASIVLTPTPVFGGYVTDNFKLLSVDDSAYLSTRLELLVAAGIKARLVIVDTTGSEPLQDFGARVGNTWNAAGEDSRSDLLILVASKDRTVRIDLTNDMNARLTDQEAKSLIDGHFQPVAAKSGLAAGLRVLVDQLDRVVAAKETAGASEEDLREKAGVAAAMMSVSVSTWDGRQPALSPISQALLDSGRARLESMPRPARGDRKLARQLHAGGMALLGQVGFEALAVDKLRLAHAADPLDAQILNDLAYFEQRVGNHRNAIEHLLKTLRLAPARTDAWANLAESLPHVAESPETVRSVVVRTYTTAYWFSHDRARTIEFLRTKGSATDVHDVVRVAAGEALQHVQRLEAVGSDGGGTALGQRP